MKEGRKKAKGKRKGKKLKIVYVSSDQFDNLIGVDYKYYTLLKQHYDIDLISCLEENWRQKVISIKPDLLFMPGFHNIRYYEFALSLGIPYILVQYDIYSWSRKKEDMLEIEKLAIQKSFGVIFASDIHRQFYEDLIPKEQLPLFETIYLRPLEKDLDFQMLSKLPGKNLVYVGNAKRRWKNRGNVAGYRAYHEIFKAFLRARWNVHLYPIKGNEHKFDAYRKMGCIVHDFVNEGAALYKELSQYTAGLHGYNLDGVKKEYKDYCQACTPNKTWEYLAAGIPTIGINPGMSGEIYNGKWGIVLDNLKNKTFFKLHRGLPQITNDLRLEQTIDHSLQKFDRLIQGAVKND